MASGFKIASAYVDVHLDRAALTGEMADLDRQLQSDTDRIGKSSGERIGKGLGDSADGTSVGKKVASDIDKELQPRAGKSGNDSGDKLAKGMQMAMVRNSPMIAAAVAGGLTAGAPLLLGAAGALFVGIAAAAVHSNTQVQSAFAGTKDAITSTFSQAASVTVPFFVGALGRIGSAVQALGPQLRDAFSALGGPIESLTTGLIDMANNAMPGIVSAVKAAGPVFQGLASLLGSIGTGIGQMFQILSEHSQAAGSVFSSLGSIVGSLLPIIGQLIGTGAELASQILPPIASALGLVSNVLNAIAPVLPAVVAGFGAFMAIRALSGPLDLLSAKLQTVAADGGKFATALAGNGAAAVSKLQGAMPALSLGLGLLATLWEQSAQQVQAWGKALATGGDEAAQAASQMQQINTAMTQGASGFALSISGGKDLANVFGVGTDAMKKAKQAQSDYYNSLSPLGQAQSDVTRTQNDYNSAVERWGAQSGQAIGAAAAYEAATQKEKDVQDKLSLAIHGVTQAMIDQANQALASADSQFAYQQDTLATKDALASLNDAIRQHGARSEEAQKATISFDQALLSQAEAAGKAAADTSGLTDKTDLARVSQQATLKELLNLKAQYGSAFPAALQNTIDQLQAAGVKLDDVGAKKPEPQVKLNDAQFQGTLSYVNTAIQTLHGQKPTPTAFMSTQPFQGAASWMDGMLTYLNGRHVTPSALLIANTLAAENQINTTARNRTVYISTVYLAGPVGSAARPQALGGIMMPMAEGGILPMAAGGMADIFQPNSPTVLIGDNTRVPESFIPQDDSPRSKAILTATASAMGYGLTPTTGTGQTNRGGDSGGSGIRVGEIHVHVHTPGVITDKDIPVTVTAAMQQAILKLERSRR